MARGLKEIPQVSIDVFKDCHGSVRLLFRRSYTQNALGLVGEIVACEVVGVQEQEHATAGLASDVLGLRFGGCTRDSSSRDSRAPGGATTTQRLFCSGTGVSSTKVNQSEPKCADVKVNCLIVVTHQDGNETEGLLHCLDSLGYAFQFFLSSGNFFARNPPVPGLIAAR